MAGYIIGVDGGSQSTKVVIFDTEGRVVAEGKKELRPNLLPAPGVVLHPDDDLWDTLVVACREALSRFPGRIPEILGMGLCTIRCCRTLLKADGRLAYPVMSWMDLRLSRPYEPEYPDVRYVTTTSGYLTHRLTGRTKDTAANYEGAWPIDKVAWQWSADPAVLKHYNVPRDMLFDLVNPGDVLGGLTPEAAEALGLPAGLPVVATANDKAVEALGSGSLSGPVALVSLGTYITSMIEGPDFIPENRAENFFTNLASRPGRYLYESWGIRRGMSTVSWMRELMGGDVPREAEAAGLSPEDYLNRQAEAVPAGCGGLMTIPDWLASPATPFKRGVMIGFDGRHTGVHMYRSILEAIALTMYNHNQAMCRERNLALERLIVSGGGSNGDLFMQIFADVFGIPAGRNLINGAVSLGSAICAAVGLGVYKNFDEAMAVMVRPRDVFRPVAENTKTYRAINDGIYRELTGFTDPILQKAFPIFGRGH